MLKQNGQCTQALAKKDGWSAIRRSLVSSACYEDEQWEVAVSLLILQWLIPENFDTGISFFCVLFCLFDWHLTLWRGTPSCVERDTQLCGEGHSAVQRGTLSCVERDTQLCGEGHSAVQRGTPSCVERDTQLCGEGHSTVWRGTLCFSLLSIKLALIFFFSFPTRVSGPLSAERSHIGTSLLL